MSISGFILFAQRNSAADSGFNTPIRRLSLSTLKLPQISKSYAGEDNFRGTSNVALSNMLQVLIAQPDPLISIIFTVRLKRFKRNSSHGTVTAQMMRSFYSNDHHSQARCDYFSWMSRRKEGCTMSFQPPVLTIQEQISALATSHSDVEVAE